MQLPRTILVPTDFSENATRALDYAVALAAKLDAKVHVLNAVSPVIIGNSVYADSVLPSVLDGNRAALEKLIADRKTTASFGAPILEIGDARDVIDNAATSIAADLIVMGTRGRRGVSRMILGSVAESVVRTAPCPVLLVRDAQHPN
jgi:nucleotide-binding universal stress UspA family protein